MSSLLDPAAPAPEVQTESRTTADRRTKVAVMSPEPVVVAGITAILARHPSRVELIPPTTPVAKAEPDVVLYDVLGLMDGDVDEFARVVSQTAAVLAIRRDQRPDLLNRALIHGAVGCLAMSIGEADLLAMLDAADERKQEHLTSPAPIICGCPSARRSSSLGVSVGLTARESQILTAIAQGLSNAEIADRDFVSINTVKTCIRSAYRKIGVCTRSQAVLWVLQHGFDA